MVSIFTKILPIAAAGIGLFFLANTIRAPTAARETAAAIGETGAAFGTSLSSVGTGIGDFLTGLGAGSAKLLDPFFSLKTLIFEEDSNASNTNRSLPNPNTSSVAGSYAAAAGPSSEEHLMQAQALPLLVQELHQASHLVGVIPQNLVMVGADNEKR